MNKMNEWMKLVQYTPQYYSVVKKKILDKVDNVVSLQKQIKMNNKIQIHPVWIHKNILSKEYQ